MEMDEEGQTRRRRKKGTERDGEQVVKLARVQKPLRGRCFVLVFAFGIHIKMEKMDSRCNGAQAPRRAALESPLKA